MRRNILAIALFFIYSLSISANENKLYYDMSINANLYTDISINTVDASIEKLFQKSEFLRLYSDALKKQIDLPILKNKKSTASGVIPYSKDWIVMGGLVNNKLNKKLSYSEPSEQKISNILFLTTYLNDENILIKKPKKRKCKNGILYINVPNKNKNNIFIMLTTAGKVERYVSQYYGKYQKSIKVICKKPEILVFVRSVLFD